MVCSQQKVAKILVVVVVVVVVASASLHVYLSFCKNPVAAQWISMKSVGIFLSYAAHSI